jgi:small subunit ribosomal protein S1
MKQLESNPWEAAQGSYAVGARFNGRVSNVTDYGAFVELENVIEGLVHVSEMSWTKKNTHPSKIVAVGQEVQVQILEVDTTKHRISLGMKQCEENPWQHFADTHKEGAEIEGEIRNITEFGLFVGLEGGIDGLVHHSDISWGESGESVIATFEKGAKVKAKILLLDVEKERVSLGIKQLSDNPNKEAATGIKKNATVTCTVREIGKDGVDVEVEGGAKGYIKKVDVAKERKDQRPERFAAGDRVDAKVLSVSKSGVINLSIKALEIDQHNQAIAEFGSTDSGASLGDILGAALSEAKKKD